jgi:repressor LexA
MNTLTETQQAILALIGERIAADGMPPSQTEISRAMGFSGVRAAQYHLEALEQAGVIRRVPGKARGIQLVQPDAGVSSDDLPPPNFDDALRLPILGRVAAGAPIGADADPGQHLLLDRAMFFPTPDYLLRVKGDSMIDDGIFDGDLIAVHRTNVAENGQIVVARVDGEITVKRFKRDRSRITLIPRNPDYAPIVVAPDADFAIEGLYCGLVRSA